MVFLIQQPEWTKTLAIEWEGEGKINSGYLSYWPIDKVEYTVANISLIFNSTPFYI